MLLPAATVTLVSFSPCESVCESSWQNVVLETPTVAGTTSDALPGVYISVSLWTDIVTMILQPYKMQYELNRCVVERMGVVRARAPEVVG